MKRDETPPAADPAEEMSEYEILTKCREHYKRIKELEDEEDRHKEAAKGCRARIDAYESEVRSIITRRDNQIALPLPTAGKA